MESEEDGTISETDEDIEDQNMREEKNDDSKTNIQMISNEPMKSSKKVETKVEVVKNQLSNGDVEEIKTTTTTTTTEGKIEVKQEVETKLVSKKEENEDETEECYTDEIIEESEDEETDDENSTLKVENNINVQDKKTETDENETSNKKSIETKTINSILKKDEYSDSTTSKKVVIIQDSNQDSNQDSSDYEADSENDIQEEHEKIDVFEEKSEDLKNKTDIELNTEKSLNDVSENNNQSEKSSLSDEKEANSTIDSTVGFKTEEIGKEKQKVQENNEIILEKYASNKVEKNMAQIDEDNNIEVKSSLENKENHIVDNDDIISNNLQQTENDFNIINNLVQSETTATDTKILNTETIKENVTEKNIEENIIKIQLEAQSDENVQKNIESSTNTKEGTNLSLQEPVVPLEKVADVDIRPINEENKALSSNDFPDIKNINESLGALQTELKRVENIITIKRTTHVLSNECKDDNFLKKPSEELIENKNVFTPPQLYNTSPKPNEGHSLLLERISVERQIPISYDCINYPQSDYENRLNKEMLDEPRSEVLNINNVKPSSVSNQCWYQQSKAENSDCDIMRNLSFSQPAAQCQVEKTNNDWNQFAPRPINSAQTFSQSKVGKPHHQWNHVEPENIYLDEKSHLNNAYPSTNGRSFNNPYIASREAQQPSFLSFQDNIYEKSSYVPPPWEQSASDYNNTYSYTKYQDLTPTGDFKRNHPIYKNFLGSTNNVKSKPKKIASSLYIPPAPNQSFVKHVDVTTAPTIPGRKTYYSEYERRFISVPESTYVPNDSKIDNKSTQQKWSRHICEQTESVHKDPEWKKELRKSPEKQYSKLFKNENKYVIPPWENNVKYTQPTTVKWTETIRPRSWREQSVEPEYTDIPESLKTQSLGRNKQYSNSNNIEKYKPDISRGVSLDRFSNQGYCSPIPFEHPPVRSQILDPAIAPPVKGHHNLKAPAYNSNPVLETNQQAAIPQPRPAGQSRSNPIQSRSFKYLQWITGTDD